MGLRHAVSLLPVAAVASCLVSIGDVDEGTSNGGASGSGNGGSSPDSSAGASGSSGGTGGSAGSGGAAASGGTGASNGGSGGEGASGGAAGSAAGGSGGSAGSSGASGTGGTGAAPSCLAPIQDDFEDGALDGHWDAYTKPTSISLTESGGIFTIELPNDAGVTLYGGLTSVSSFDATGCAILIRALKVPNTSAVAAYSHFALHGGDGDYAEFFASKGALLLQRWEGGNAQTVVSEPYDAAAHAWWKIREQGGTLYFETSSDGKTWTLFGSTSSPFDPSSATIGIGAGAYQVEATPGGAAFDDLNLPPQ